MDVFLLLVRLVLAGVFGLAGVTKLADLPGSRSAMRNFGVPERFSGPAGLALPLVELAVAVMLLPKASAWWAALIGMVLLLAFIVGIGYNLAMGRTPDCHCFGQVYSEPVGKPTLVRNAILAALAAFLLLQGPDHPGSSVVGWLGGVTPSERVILGLGIVLVAGMAGIGWLLIQLMQQNGRLLLRVEALENGQPVSPTPSPSAAPEAGLLIGTLAPAFSLKTPEGETVTLEDLREGGRRVLLVFTDVSCGPCNALMPDVGRWQQEYGDALTIALVSRGSAEANAAKQREHGLTRVLVQRDREVSQAYESIPTPSAVLVRPDGTIGSRAALGAQAIRSLVTQSTTRTLPVAAAVPNGNGAAPARPPSRVGQPAPAVQLPGLSGEQVSLEAFKGDRTLVLFWNPGCGFCKRMQDDLKAWEANPPEDAPRLLVVSTGTVEANREMGLQAPVVLDQGFTTGRTFGASGTPSAVLIDAEGKIASEVAVGAPAVLALAGGTTGQTASASQVQ
jgi:peroxiredoxin/uncharacterized membrane protein YphA (DoxX/SURF4 family)